jgi:hypothetical protein
LSRHNASVATDGDRKPLDDNLGDTLTRETVFTAQQQDTYCKGLITKVRTDNKSGYLISADGLLYVGQVLGKVGCTSEVDAISY